MTAHPIPPPCSDEVIERAFCDPEVVKEAWTTAGQVAADACRLESDAKSPALALPAIVRLLGERGVLGVAVPGSVGGTFDDVRSIALCLVRERLGHASPLVELAFAMQALGSYPITARGNEAQRSEWLTGVAAGELVAAFALTEAEAGSDLGGIATTARRDGDAYVLDGEKILISNAGIASFYVVFAATAPPGAKKRLSAFVVPAKSAGLRTTPTRVLGGHPIGTVHLAGVRVPVSQRLGEEGDGLSIALETLHRLRPTVGAAAMGLAQRSLDETLRHVSPSNKRCRCTSPTWRSTSRARACSSTARRRWPTSRPRCARPRAARRRRSVRGSGAPPAWPSWAPPRPRSA